MEFGPTKTSEQFSAWSPSRFEMSKLNFWNRNPPRTFQRHVPQPQSNRPWSLGKWIPEAQLINKNCGHCEYKLCDNEQANTTTSKSLVTTRNRAPTVTDGVLLYKHNPLRMKANPLLQTNHHTINAPLVTRNDARASSKPTCSALPAQSNWKQSTHSMFTTCPLFGSRNPDIKSINNFDFATYMYNRTWPTSEKIVHRKIVEFQQTIVHFRWHSGGDMSEVK